jgi:hypothetical protein
MTPSEGMFLELYFGILKALRTDWRDKVAAAEARRQIGLRWDTPGYHKPTDVWRAFLPIPQAQQYFRDPLSSSASYQHNINYRFDYLFWDGDKLIAVEIDGAEPAGYERDIVRDRLSRYAGMDMIHFLNREIMDDKASALLTYLPRKFFGFDWDYPSTRPHFEEEEEEIPF